MFLMQSVSQISYPGCRFTACLKREPVSVIRKDLLGVGRLALSAVSARNRQVSGLVLFILPALFSFSFFFLS